MRCKKNMFYKKYKTINQTFVGLLEERLALFYRELYSWPFCLLYETFATVYANKLPERIIILDDSVTSFVSPRKRKEDTERERKRHFHEDYESRVWQLPWPFPSLLAAEIVSFNCPNFPISWILTNGQCHWSPMLTLTRSHWETESSGEVMFIFLRR